MSDEAKIRDAIALLRKESYASPQTMEAIKDVCDCAEQLRADLSESRRLLDDARAELEASESLRSATISTMRRNEAELTEARRLLDESRITLVGIAGATARAWELPRSEFIDEFLPWAQSRARDTAAKIAAPVPAQPAAGVAAIAKAVRDIPSRLESLGGQRFAYVKLSEVIETIYSVAGKQPAAVPEAVAKDAAPSCFTCIHCDKDDEDYPCRSCRMMSHWSSAALLSAADAEVKK